MEHLGLVGKLMRTVPTVKQRPRGVEDRIRRAIELLRVPGGLLQRSSRVHGATGGP